MKNVLESWSITHPNCACAQKGSLGFGPRNKRYPCALFHCSHTPKRKWEHIWCKPQFCENPCKSRQKSHLNSPKKNTHIDDMMIHNLVKYLVQTRLCLWDIKITNFKPESCPDDLLEICYFYISHKWSWVWTRYFARLCIIISSTCVIFLVNLDDFFAVVYTGFYKDCGFHQIRCHITYYIK